MLTFCEWFYCLGSWKSRGKRKEADVSLIWNCGKLHYVLSLASWPYLPSQPQRWNDVSFFHITAKVKRETQDEENWVKLRHVIRVCVSPYDIKLCVLCPRVLITGNEADGCTISPYINDGEGKAGKVNERGLKRPHLHRLIRRSLCSQVSQAHYTHTLPLGCV